MILPPCFLLGEISVALIQAKESRLHFGHGSVPLMNAAVRLFSSPLIRATDGTPALVKAVERSRNRRCLRLRSGSSFNVAKQRRKIFRSCSHAAFRRFSSRVTAGCSPLLITSSLITHSTA